MKRKISLNLVIFALGLLIFAVGLYLIYPPAAFIGYGAILMVISLFGGDLK